MGSLLSRSKPVLGELRSRPLFLVPPRLLSSLFQRGLQPEDVLGCLLELGLQRRARRAVRSKLLLQGAHLLGGLAKRFLNDGRFLSRCVSFGFSYALCRLGIEDSGLCFPSIDG